MLFNISLAFSLLIAIAKVSNAEEASTLPTTITSESENTSIDLKLCSQSTNIAILRGRDGRDGPKGDKGDKGDAGPPGIRGSPGGGSVYTRWGKSTCPITEGTELIYSGITSGSSHNTSGGGTNHICMPKTTESDGDARTSYFTLVSNTLYKGMLGSNFNAENKAAACAVCYTPARSVNLMIPGQLSCPSQWTKEYSGYLMSGFETHKQSSMFECIDEEFEGTTVDSTKSDGYLYHTVQSTDKSYKPITCVFCTK